MIKPTIGRRVWFWPNGCTSIGGFIPHVISPAQPFDAGIVYVWSDRMVNLDVKDHYGQPIPATSVPLLQDGETPPASGAYATWMPYQQAQSAAAAQHPAVAAAGPVAPFADGSVGGA